MSHEEKKPSSGLMAMVNEWADSYIKSTELPVKILQAAQAEGLNKQQIRKIVEDVLVKRGLSERRIREVLPAELKDHNKIRSKPVAALSAAKPEEKIELVSSEEIHKLAEVIKNQKIDPVTEPEEPTDLELLQIENEQLKDALHKTEQFKPATVLQEPTLLDPLETTLRNSADGVHSFYYDTYGIDLFRNRELSQLKNSGVKVFKRLYFEV